MGKTGKMIDLKKKVFCCFVFFLKKNFLVLNADLPKDLFTVTREDTGNRTVLDEALPRRRVSVDVDSVNWENTTFSEGLAVMLVLDSEIC